MIIGVVFVMITSANGQIDGIITWVENIDFTFRPEGEYMNVVSEPSTYLNEIGAPNLPYCVKTFLVPVGVQPSVQIHSVNKELLKSDILVYPAQPQVIISSVPEWVEPDSRIYNSSNPYPGNYAEIISDREDFGYHLVTVKISPLEYVPNMRKLYLCDISFSLTYSSTSPSSASQFSVNSQSGYLNELDKFVETLKESFDVKTPYTLTLEYKALQQKRANTRAKINRRQAGEERNQLIAQYEELGKELRKTPAKLCNDKKLKYVRYADDFLIAVNGSKEDCEWIKAQLTEFIRGTLRMELSQEKTLITHSNESARFLGYDVRVRRDQTVKPWKNCKQRTLNNTVELLIPLKDKIEKYLFSHGVVRQREDNGKLEPVARVALTRNTDLEIVTTYDAELRGLCNYYFLASNYRSLNYFSYLMEYSCLKTLAWKHRCKLSKIYNKYRTGAKRWGIPYETKKGKKIRYLTKFNEIDGKKCEDVEPKIVKIIATSKTTIDSRLKACRCELCGHEGNDRKYEVHHVNKVKNLRGKEPWEVVMIAKKRKTLVVCHDCHQMIHHGF